jgi:hypothetical protein
MNEVNGSINVKFYIIANSILKEFATLKGIGELAEKMIEIKMN